MSYRHVLGFDKVVLLSTPPLGRLRMHIWWPDSTYTPMEHPHNHRYCSHSVVVAGKLRTNMYQPGDVGSDVIHYQETTAPGEALSKFVRKGKTRLLASMKADIVAGGSYSMSAGMVHQIETPRELTVTIFLEMARVRSWSDIFVHERDQFSHSQARRYFDVYELRDRLTRLKVHF